MIMLAKHVIVLNVVGLPRELKRGQTPNICALADNGASHEMVPSFPAVTCPVQATVTTGMHPSEHGIIANGWMDRESYQVSFWEQNANLVRAPRIWDILSGSGLKTAVLFWQHTLYANSDVIVTPKPIHLDNELVLWCYSKPIGFYEEIAGQIGEFDLMSYWGPLASRKSSQWIASCAMHTLEKWRPNLLMVYLPQADYSAQRFGPVSAEVDSDITFVDGLVGSMVAKTEELGIAKDTTFVVFSEYAFNEVRRSVSLNVRLRDAGLLAVRRIKGREYADYEHSRAFAVADHQLAHIYVKAGYVDEVKSALGRIEGIASVLDERGKKERRISSDRSGELVALADSDAWFNYYWWYDSTHAPPFAYNVDIHRKPGYDPLELFLDHRSRTVSMDTGLIRGSHGADTEPVPLVIGGSAISSRTRLPADTTQVAPTIASILGVRHGFQSPPLSIA